MKGFKNVKAYVEGKGIITTDIAVKDGIIYKIGNNLDIDEVFPYGSNQVVLPGFIDEHIHGADGCDAMDGDKSALSKIANAVKKEGTTGFLATTMTQSKENILKSMKAVKEYIKSNPSDGADVLGVHLEGPFISKKHIGAQPLEHLQVPEISRFDEYNSESGNNIKIVSLAPEEEGADKLISYMTSKGVVASAGHTDAGYNDIKKAIEFGLSNITHTYNAQRSLHHREVGTVGSAMLFDTLNCEMICDLIHLSAPAIMLLVKNKPHDKITLITDSMRAKWLQDGESELGGQKVFVKNGEARLADGTLAGSILKMNDAIKNIVLNCNVPFTDAVDFATINPAKNLKLDKEIGSIKEGKKANFTVLSGEFEVCLTVKGGNVIYKA